MFITGAPVGYYSVALGVSEVFYYVSGSASVVLFSKKRIDEKSNRKHLQVVRLMIPTGIAAAVVLGICGNLLVPLLWGEAFVESSVLIWLILPGCVAYAAIQTLSPFLVQLGLTRAISSGYIAGLFAVVVSSILLVPLLGARGAAITYSTSFFCALIVMSIITVRINSKVSLADLFSFTAF